jgi:two-component system phosphate regulon sensor histidine kinase PhoR
VEGIIIALIIVTVIAISTTLLLLIRERANRSRIGRLHGAIQDMLDNQVLQRDWIAPQVELSGVDEALRLLAIRLGTLASELGDEREKSAAILSTINAGVLIIDKERQVTVLNEAAEKMFGITGESAVGQPLISSLRDYEIDGLIQKCLETAEQQAGVVQQSGGKRYFELTAMPLGDGALVLVQDLTSIRRLERVRQDFIGNISHELRTPIASLKAIVETLLNGAITDKNVAEDFLQRMQIETDKLAQMVDELSELSRIESGELSIRLEPVDVAGVVKKVAGRLRAQADRARLNLNLDILPELPRVIGDEDRIEQVLVNITHNAIKFTPENGSITISSKAEGNMVSISVSDTGIGIPEDDLPHIFERFYKVDKARSGGGTGLGLSIAKHIVRAHGGDISVESEEGKGSTFTFRLPTSRS